ncbi:hypothetical protein IR120_04625 [Muribacter muris]|nr:hypothetical protein [Muribacter muris]MBF0784756.1 hypothetical protein [Muribacter muris]MBF0827797.1 hypothetical protein [Muribacter muris]
MLKIDNGKSPEPADFPLSIKQAVSFAKKYANPTAYKLGQLTAEIIE